MLTAHPPESLLAMQDHFDVMHSLTSHAEPRRALAMLRQASAGRLPILAIFRAVIPWVPRIMANTMKLEDWLALADAIVALIPGPPPDPAATKA